MAGQRILSGVRAMKRISAKRFSALVLVVLMSSPAMAQQESGGQRRGREQYVTERRASTKNSYVLLDCVAAVAGGSDAGVTALNAMAFGVIGAIAPAGDDPSRAVAPL
jgi:hypothetical protein